MSVWDEGAGDLQQQLDRKDWRVGDQIKSDFAALGNGSPDRPLLAAVGVDRCGRLWRIDRGIYTMIGTTIVCGPEIKE